jgi:signal transduction histidine kinase
MKHISAIITAILITTIIGLGIIVIGVSALTNKNTVALQNSTNQSVSGKNLTNTSGNSSGVIASTSPEVQQLQQQVSDLQSQLDQENQVVQQYQSLLIALQQRGLISIDQRGNIYLPQGDNN